MNVVFFGSSRYCLPVVETLKNHFNLVAIVTKHGSPIASFAKKYQTPFLTPINKKELSTFIDKISELKPDIAIVADYGLIIPKEIFNTPKYGTLNIHFSRLPKLRGACPVQYTILTDQTPWISIIKMNENLDTGDIIWQKEYKKSTNFKLTNQLISNQLVNETAESLYIKLFQYIASELPTIIRDYINDKLVPKKQNHKEATYTRMLTREDGFIPFELIIKAINSENPPNKQLDNWPLYKNLIIQFPTSNFQFPIIIDRAIRALTPWPGLWTEIDLRRLKSGPMDSFQAEKPEKTVKKRLKLLKAHIDDDNRLILDLVQLEGKKPVSWKQFREGYPDIKLGNS